ncbi:MAG: mechanosensitive ion channel [Hyphomicrobiaceae bacterium]
MAETASVDVLTRLLDMTQSIELAILLYLAGSAVVGLVAFLVVRFILSRLLSRYASGPSLMKRLKGPLSLMAVLLFAAIALPAADFTPEISENLRHALRIGVILLTGWSAIVIIETLATYFTRRNRLDVENNLEARRLHTQISILKRAGEVVIILITTGAVLMTFPTVQHVGVSLFASAGAAGLVLGFAARPILANLIAGIQIALTQPIRLDDVVIVEGEWGWIEEITSTYVVVRIWDLRRLIVPLSYFIEKPFQNWTRESAAIIGSVTWNLDYRAPVDEMRAKLDEILAGNPRWDGKVANVQVTEAAGTAITVRALMSSSNSPAAWDLRCEVREKMIAWLKEAHPEALPRVRASLEASALPPADNLPAGERVARAHA